MITLLILGIIAPVILYLGCWVLANPYVVYGRPVIETVPCPVADCENTDVVVPHLIADHGWSARRISGWLEGLPA